MFNNEQGFKLDSLFRFRRSSSFKAGEAFCCFNSDWPVRQVSDPIKATGFALQTFNCACPFLSLNSAELHNFHELPPAPWLKKTNKQKAQKTYFTGGRVLSQPPCVGGRKGGLSSLLCFPKSLFGWKGPGATISLGYKLIPLLLLSKGPIVYWLCSGRWLSLLAHLSTPALLGDTVSNSYHQPSRSDGYGRHSSQQVGCGSTSYLGMSQLGPMASKTPHLSLWIRQICALVSSLVGVCPDLVLHMSKVADWDHYLGAEDMN